MTVSLCTVGYNPSCTACFMLHVLIWQCTHIQTYIAMVTMYYTCIFSAFSIDDPYHIKCYTCVSLSLPPSLTPPFFFLFIPPPSSFSLSLSSPSPLLFLPPPPSPPSLLSPLSPSSSLSSFLTLLFLPPPPSPPDTFS